MPKRISIATHFNTSELEQLYRKAANAIESRQRQVIWLLAQGKKTEEVEKITGYSRTWIYRLVKRYNQFGIGGLGDHRSENQGTKTLINDIMSA